MELADEGKTVDDIYKLTSIPKRKIYKRLYKYRGQINKANPSLYNWQEAEEKIIAMIVDGYTYTEIAKKTGINIETLRKFCQRKGPQGLLRSISLQKQEKKIAEELEKLNLGITLIGGYINNNSPVIVQCNTCNKYFVWNVRHVRKRIKSVRCPHCWKDRKSSQHSQKKAHATAALINKGKGRITTYIERREKTAVCKFCETQYRKRLGYGNTQKIYCSEKCFTAARERAAENARHHRDRRLKKCKKKEWGINVPRLYKRDGGICWICGSATDLSDKVTREDGTIVCGDWYPSVDHVIPIAEGGDHTWDNVKLAHRRCNSERWWKNQTP